MHNSPSKQATANAERGRGVATGIAILEGSARRGDCFKLLTRGMHNVLCKFRLDADRGEVIFSDRPVRTLNLHLGTL